MRCTTTAKLFLVKSRNPKGKSKAHRITWLFEGCTSSSAGFGLHPQSSFGAWPSSLKSEEEAGRRGCCPRGLLVPGPVQTRKKGTAWADLRGGDADHSCETLAGECSGVSLRGSVELVRHQGHRRDATPTSWCVPGDPKGVDVASRSALRYTDRPAKKELKKSINWHRQTRSPYPVISAFSWRA